MEKFYIEKLTNFRKHMNKFITSEEQLKSFNKLDPLDKESRRLFTGWISLIIEPIRKNKTQAINELLYMLSISKENVVKYKQSDIDLTYEYLLLFCDLINGRIK